MNYDTKVPGVRVTNEDRTWWVQADSVAALNALSKKPHAKNTFIHSNLTRPDYGGRARDWDGTATNAEARQILDSGSWEEGVQRVVENLAKLEMRSRPRNVKRARQWTDQGDSLDIHRVYAGNLGSAWQRCVKRNVVASRNITLLCNITISGSTPAEALFWRGAAALMAVDVLSEAGYNVEVEATDTGDRACENGENLVVSTTVKESQAPLDLNALAVSLCLGAFLRRTSFAAECAIPTSVKSSLGSPAPYRQLIPESRDGREFVLCEGITDKWQAEKWLQQLIETIDQKAEAI